MSKNEWKGILKAELFLPEKLNITDFNSDCCKDAAIHMKNLATEFDIHFKNAADGRGWIRSKEHLRRIDNMNKDYCDELYKALENGSMEIPAVELGEHRFQLDTLYVRKVVMLWDGCDNRARRLFGNYTDEERGFKRAR